MIASFGDKATEALFHGTPQRLIRRFPPEVRRVAPRKLDLINAAGQLRDLSSPPGNRLERLKGDLAGFHSIRVNDQLRVVFRFTGADAHEVSLIDYHD